MYHFENSVHTNQNYTIETIFSAIRQGHHPSPPHPGLFDPTSVMALFSTDPEIKLLFIQKADVKGYAWANQMAFPGGHQDKTDSTTLDTALRELEEEMGIIADNVDVIGSIGHFQTLNNKDIEAWTGIWNRKDAIVFDPKEISRVIEIPLSHLMLIHQEQKYMEKEPSIMTVTYPYEDVVVWGVTAKIVCHMINLFLWQARI